MAAGMVYMHSSHDGPAGRDAEHLAEDDGGTPGPFSNPAFEVEQGGPAFEEADGYSPGRPGHSLAALAGGPRNGGESGELGGLLQRMHGVSDGVLLPLGGGPGSSRASAVSLGALSAEAVAAGLLQGGVASTHAAGVQLAAAAAATAAHRQQAGLSAAEAGGGLAGGLAGAAGGADVDVLLELSSQVVAGWRCWGELGMEWALLGG
jgi:hypothetical protein